MKHLFNLLFLSFFIVMMAGCGEDDLIPDHNNNENNLACFTVGPEDRLFAGAWLRFNPCKENLKSFYWDFGDGTTSDDESPTKRFMAAGTYKVKLVAGLGEIKDSVIREIVIARPDTIIHTAYVSEDEVWDKGYHLISGSVTLTTGNLTIEPGAIILFQSGSQLIVGQEYRNFNPTLTAIGTPENPIIFKVDTSKNYNTNYNGFVFTRFTNPQTTFKYCNFYDAGYLEGYYGFNLKDCSITIENCNIKNFGAGVFNCDNSYFKSFTNNTITNYKGYAFKIDANYAHTIGNSTTINGTGGIYINSNAFTNGSQTWYKQDVAYLIDRRFSIYAPSGKSDAILTLKPGVTIAFKNKIDIIVNSQGRGAIIAEGTASDPITFTSANEIKAAGDWGCFKLQDYGVKDDLPSRFDYCIFEYGGSSNSTGSTLSIHPMMYVWHIGTHITHSTFQHSQNEGIEMYSRAYFRNFKNNTFNEIPSYSIRIVGNAVHTIGTGNTFKNAGAIKVTYGAYEQASATWHKQDVPYLIGGLSIGSSKLAESELTIEPGTKFLIFSGGISVGTNGKGRLIADGTSEPILFTSTKPAGSQAPGDWHGITMGNKALPGTILANCQIQYAGSMGSDGAVLCDGNGSNVEIRNCHISYSGSYAIVRKNGATPVLSNNTYSNNVSGDVVDL